MSLRRSSRQKRPRSFARYASDDSSNSRASPTPASTSTSRPRRSNNVASYTIFSDESDADDSVGSAGLLPTEENDSSDASDSLDESSANSKLVMKLGKEGTINASKEITEAEYDHLQRKVDAERRRHRQVVSSDDEESDVAAPRKRRMQPRRSNTIVSEEETSSEIESEDEESEDEADETDSDDSDQMEVVSRVPARKGTRSRRGSAKVVLDSDNEEHESEKDGSDVDASKGPGDDDDLDDVAWEKKLLEEVETEKTQKLSNKGRWTKRQKAMYEGGSASENEAESETPAVSRKTAQVSNLKRDEVVRRRKQLAQQKEDELKKQTIEKLLNREGQRSKDEKLIKRQKEAIEKEERETIELMKHTIRYCHSKTSSGLTIPFTMQAQTLVTDDDHFRAAVGILPEY